MMLIWEFPETDWIKLNKNTIGLYRTNYSPALLARLVILFKEQTPHSTDRLGLQSDVFVTVYLYIIILIFQKLKIFL